MSPFKSLPVSTSGGFPSWIISRLHSCSTTLPVSSEAGDGAGAGAGAGGGGGGGGVSSNDKRDKSLSVWPWLVFTAAAKYCLLAVRLRLPLQF